MAYVSEFLFVDPSVDDIETILSGLRPGVEARVLDAAHAGGAADRGRARRIS